MADIFFKRQPNWIQFCKFTFEIMVEEIIHFFNMVRVETTSTYILLTFITINICTLFAMIVSLINSL